MSDLDGRATETETETLVRVVGQLARAVERLDERVNGRLDAFEQQVMKRLDRAEHQVDEIGSGLAVVLKRSDDTKKKLPVLPAGFKSWLSVWIGGSTRKSSDLTP